MCLCNHKALTEDGDDLLVLDDFQGARDHEAERVQALALVEDEISGGAVRHVEVHGQGSKTPVTRQPEGRMFQEHLPVQVHTQVGLHVFRAVV